jgi:N-acetylneuraminic acid mutarotase
MKIRLLALLVSGILFSSVYISCNKSTDTAYIGNWVKRSELGGIARGKAVSFCIGNIGYLGFGYDDTKNQSLSDFWQYDSDKDSWTQIAKPVFYGTKNNIKDTIVAAARYSAVGFSVNGLGYVGTGFDGVNYMNDFWRYNPNSNTWDTITRFSGTKRFGAVAFGIDQYGYVGTGYDGNFLKDFWSYNPASNSWTSIATGGDKRRFAVAFVIGGKGYVCTGVKDGGYVNDCYRYNPATGSWEQLRDIANTSPDSYDDAYKIIRSNAVGFATSDKGYVAFGYTGSIVNDVWEYNPATDLWIQKTSLIPASGSGAREDAVSFSVNNRIFVTTGYGGYDFDDTWEFKPYDTYVPLTQ